MVLAGAAVAIRAREREAMMVENCMLKSSEGVRLKNCRGELVMVVLRKKTI